MCFGDSETTKTTTNQVDPSVRAAATGNIDFVQNLRNQGFTPYGGQQVANFSPQQQQSFGMVGNIAGNNTAPTAAGMIGNYANAPASSVQANTTASAMNPYMNQYVMQALAPQLQQFDIQDAATRAATNATATGSGAFGDARTGIEQANNQFLSNTNREGLIGNAYNAAFNTAIGAGTGDVNRQLQAGTTNAQLQETALQRQLGGATALEGLQNQQLGVAGAVNQMGQQQTAQQQAQLNAQYQQYLMGTQYPFQTAQLMNQTTGVSAAAIPAGQTSVQQQPDNSGLALVGALGSAWLGSSDRRVKDDISEIGELRDGTPVYSFRYKTDPKGLARLGLMSDDVRERRPDAVHAVGPGGTDMVDYAKATELSRLLEGVI